MTKVTQLEQANAAWYTASELKGKEDENILHHLAVIVPGIFLVASIVGMVTSARYFPWAFAVYAASAVALAYGIRSYLRHDAAKKKLRQQVQSAVDFLGGIDRITHYYSPAYSFVVVKRGMNHEIFPCPQFEWKHLNNLAPFGLTSHPATDPFDYSEHYHELIVVVPLENEESRVCVKISFCFEPIPHGTLDSVAKRAMLHATPDDFRREASRLVEEYVQSLLWDRDILDWSSSRWELELATGVDSLRSENFPTLRVRYVSACYGGVQCNQ